MTDPYFDVQNYPALASFPNRGFIKTVPDGFTPETLPCVLSLLGADPPKHIRGWVEALGMGVDVGANDLIFRGSWAALDENGICAGFRDAPEDVQNLLASPPGNTLASRYVPIDRYKCLLILPGCAAYLHTFQTETPFDMFGKHFSRLTYPDIPLLKETLSRLNISARQSKRVLIPWAASVAPSGFRFAPLKRSAAVCGANVVKGIARALGMALATTGKCTGDVNTDLRAKIKSVLALAEEFDFVLLHIGGCDEVAHRRDKPGKESFMKEIDRAVLPELLRSRHKVRVTADHGCDPFTGKHTGGLQPVYFT